jgi:hypothetical protein
LEKNSHKNRPCRLPSVGKNSAGDLKGMFGMAKKAGSVEEMNAATTARDAFAK